MFTGIVEAKSGILSAHAEGALRRMRVASPRGWRLTRGQSVNVDGICSTVVARTSTSFEVEYMPETLRKTTAREFRAGRTVNLERALRFGARVEGHLVQGHVDCAARVVATPEMRGARTLVLAVPTPFTREIVLHGAIALNGVSLTVAGKRGATIRVALIPYTLAHTNLGVLAIGSSANLEIDRSAALLRSLSRATVVPHAPRKKHKTRGAARRLQTHRRHRRRGL